ncbi:MAG: hypothetical protein LBH79_00470 [Nitrososphaerota archaeon]|nr:hypothetical protein [Nitrososphaerota archaeon]
MHHKGIFVLAGVFLAVALVVPVVVFILQAPDGLIITENPSGMETGGDLPTVPVQPVQQGYVMTLFVVIVVEVVFISLFIVAIYYGIRHVHSYH